MTPSDELNNRSSTAKVLSPEDLRVGDYVSPFNETVEILWVHDHTGFPTIEVLRTRIPTNAIPMKVKAVCLQFLTVKAGKRTRIIDIRQTELVRLDPDFARFTRMKLKDR